ncbi:MAG: HsdR family type I site-specific deoxyribonuclease [Desulfurococcales archaeon]|jgi:type I restriction enzyme R subunit|nr:HsdR family type I site-specific deoxyribonuclease [Desulfurococcales archaeon]
MSEEDIVKVFLDTLSSLGWRKSNYCQSVVREDFFINESFRTSFERINYKIFASEKLEDSEKDIVFAKVRDLLERAEPHEFLEYLRSGINVEIGRKRLKVFLIDYDDIDNNEFTFCREVYFYSGEHNVRFDVILYVNGIPLIVVEAENLFRLGEKALEDGIAQLLRYEKEVSQLFKYVQIGIVYTDEENSVYMPMSRDWRGIDRWRGRWRDFNDRYNIYDFLRKDRLLDILRWFVFYKGREKREKIIPRYNQYWAVKKSVDRIISYLEGHDHRNRGLIWHWQGSGKTYIMFYIAYQFFKRFFDKDPIIFFIVDRRELQRQLLDEFIKDVYAPYFQEDVKVIESIEDLKTVLREIKTSEINKLTLKRGVYVVLIHKFRPEELEDIPSINKREIIILLDEAHRSLYGVLGASLNRVLPNAVKLAFTGTPVMSYERNTFIHFAYPHLNELYLHKYFISDSIRDGYTLPIKYEVVQEIKGLKINVSQEEIKDLLNTWAEKIYEIGSLDDLADEEVREIPVSLRDIRQRLNKITVFLENPKRLNIIADYIAERIIEDTENFRYKALIVVASRLACVRMKKALDDALTRRFGEEAKKWSEVLMTYLSDEHEKEISDYLEELLSRWRSPEGKVLRDWGEVNRRIQDSFKEGEDPKILIVTDMLITGFDYPKLKVMYLDKPIYEHRLLQAVARVNRPYRSQDIIKEFGLVVDFVGLLDNVKETIAKYELLDKNVYKEIFEESIKTTKDALEELEHLIIEIKQRLMTGLKIGVHEIKIDIDEIIRSIDEGSAFKYVEDLTKKTKLIALGYVKYDPIILELVIKMRRVSNIYRALGGNRDKLKFHKYVVVITKLYNAVKYYINASKLPEDFWRDLLKMVHEETYIPEIDVVKESMIGSADLEEVMKKFLLVKPEDPETKYVAAEAILTIKSLLDLEPANPVYKYIYERLKKLEEAWMRRIDENLIINIKELTEDLLKYVMKRKSMDPVDRIIYDLKEFINRRYGKNIDKLYHSEPLIREILNRYRSQKEKRSLFFEEDKRKIKITLLKDLYKIGVTDIREASSIADEMVDHIERQIFREF